MADDELTITGNDYHIYAYRMFDGTWAVDGYYRDAEIDSVWAGFELESFSDADSAVLDLISNY